MQIFCYTVKEDSRKLEMSEFKAGVPDDSASINRPKPDEMSPLESTGDGEQSTYFVEKISIPKTDEEVHSIYF